jgi:hypothetical protein
MRGGLGDTVDVIRRRLAVTAALLAALVGEWLGHSVAYYRVAGLAGLQAGLTSGVHDYMLPLGALLLVAAAAGAAKWARAWLALGRRLDRSMAVLARLRRGQLPLRAPDGGSAPSPAGQAGPTLAARVLALALPLAAVQSSLFLLQENLERSLHGIPAGGLAPLLDGFGAAAWIQALVALILSTFLVLATRLLRSRAAAAQRWERLARSLWRRLQRGTSSAPPALTFVTPARLLLRSALWQRPPPALFAA